MAKKFGKALSVGEGSLSASNTFIMTDSIEAGLPARLVDAKVSCCVPVQE